DSTIGSPITMHPLRSTASKTITPASLSCDQLTAGIAEPPHSGLCDDGLVTVPEAADFLRVSRSSVYAMMEQGKLPFAKFGKSRRIPRQALMELVQQSMVSHQ